MDDDFWGGYDNCHCGSQAGEPCINMRPPNRERPAGWSPDYVTRPHRDRPKRVPELSDFRHTVKTAAMLEALAALRIKLLGEIDIGATGRDLVAVGKELMQLDGALLNDPDRTRADFERLRDRLAEQVDEANDRAIPPRDVAAMVRLLREVIVTLDGIPTKDTGASNVVSITERVAAKRQQAESTFDSTDGDRDVRA